MKMFGIAPVQRYPVLWSNVTEDRPGASAAGVTVPLGSQTRRPAADEGDNSGYTDTLWTSDTVGSSVSSPCA